MTRKPDRPGSRTVEAGGAHVVAVVVPEPADAAALVDLQPAGAEIAVVCLAAGGKESRAVLERALEAAAGRGCRVPGSPRVLAGTGSGDVATVAALLDELRGIDPERLHTLDPDPPHASYDREAGAPVHDVPAAHAETAARALEAARAWQAETGRPLYVDCHRADADTRFGATGCRRYPAPGNWLSAGFDGRLTAFLPTAGGVVRWWQDAQGRWTGPVAAEAAGLLPGLLVVRDPHGSPHLFGLRRTDRGDGGVDVDVVHAAQYRTGEPLTPWQTLGGPNAADWRLGREVGFPAAAFDAAGNLYVFARNFGQSISWRCRPADGAWTKWQHLGGARVADDLVAVTGPHGGVEVYGRLRDTAGVVRWYPGRDGTWTEDRKPPVAPRPGTLAAAPEPGAVLFRDLRTNEASVWRPGAPAPCPLGEAAGTGPLAAARGVEMDGWTSSLLLGAGPGGNCLLGAYPEGRPDQGVWWQDLGAPSLGAPAVAVSRTGRLTVATGGAGRQLSLAPRQERPGTLAFGDWRPVQG